jgi:hypothetical protein
MIFRVYDHYDDAQHENDMYNTSHECFICYDEITLQPISLKTQSFYTKLCRCDGWIHKTCLDTWYKRQNKCPVCRTTLSKNDSKTNILTIIIQYSKAFDTRLRLILSRISKLTMYILLFYISFEYYCLYCVTKNVSRIRGDTIYS